MLEEFISPDPHARVLVLFGGNPHRRDAVIRHLSSMGSISIYGSLSEEEGYALIDRLPKVDLILIGGRYDEAQRKRILAFAAHRNPFIPVTQPGIDYPYTEENIYQQVKKILQIQP